MAANSYQHVASAGAFEGVREMNDCQHTAPAGARTKRKGLLAAFASTPINTSMMKDSHTISLLNEDGFTIQELLVVIVTGSLLVGFAYAFYLFVMKTLAHDMRVREHRQSVQRIAGIAVLDIERSMLVELADSALILKKPGREDIVYRTVGGAIARNHQLLAPADEAWWVLRITRCSDSAGTGVQLFCLELRATWVKDSFSVRTQVSIPWSSASEFVNTMRRNRL